MTDQKSDLSIPNEWKERFLIKRIGEENIEISLEARNEILKALNEGARFIQIGKFTLMLNSIKSIDPKWGSYNIPPRPEVYTGSIGWDEERDMMVSKEHDGAREKAQLWDKLFKNKLV